MTLTQNRGENKKEIEGKINRIHTDSHYMKLNNMGAWHFDSQSGVFYHSFPTKTEFSNEEIGNGFMSYILQRFKHFICKTVVITPFSCRWMNTECFARVKVPAGCWFLSVLEHPNFFIISDVLVRACWVKKKALTSYKVISIFNISQLRSEDYEPSLSVVLNKYFKQDGGFAK